MNKEDLKAKLVVTGPLFPEPVRIITVTPMGDSIRLIGQGLKSNQVHQPILTPDQILLLEASPDKPTYDGDSKRFKLGIEAIRLGLAYEYDPYFSLSIARVDPLPHQLEAVYDYMLKSPRLRFLLADDPGAGKTIMAGLLIKELKMRGLIKRILLITPANLSFQWQREMREKFRENFEVIRGDVLRANYGVNPWQERDQLITSVSWVSRIEDANESLLRSQWDLIIVDEAHRMSAASEDRKTLAYQLGEELSQRTDHYLLMTATPHKGDPENFCLFLKLLDRDVYGDVKSLEEAMKRNNAPFYLRRTKEALVQFPDPETGEVKKLFTNREVETVGFEIDTEEWDFYIALTKYVEDQSIKAAQADTATGRILGFTMALLQRRFASSVRAARRSLERMRDKRQRIVDDPEGYKQQQYQRRMPDDFDELPEDEQEDILEKLEEVVASVDPVALRAEIFELGLLIEQAKKLEEREVESKLTKLREILNTRGIFEQKDMKLLIFTEHKDTLDYLVEKLRGWELSVTQIHGGMKIGDRDEPGTRIHAEKEFRDEAQILVATEAAGEGINLQFCWFMINYDIPWNPVRLEQRMGRIHRYGQEHDCLVLNFVATNTREGRVLQRLHERLLEIRSELGTDQVFDVVGQIFPANTLDRLIRDMYAKRINEDAIKNRIVQDVDASKFKAITEHALEGLAKKELNLSKIIGNSVEAKERRLVPEAIEDFFVEAAHLSGIQPTQTRSSSHLYRIGRIPRNLLTIGERLEPQFGRLGRDYRQILFDKELLRDEATSEWVTPGHPLFEAVREDLSNQARTDLEHGSIFYDVSSAEPYHLDVFTASVKDGRGYVLQKRMYVVQTERDGDLTVKQPTIFLDIMASTNSSVALSDDRLPNRQALEQFLVERSLTPLLEQVTAERKRDVETISKHLEISLNELIHREQLKLIDLIQQQEKDPTQAGIAGRVSIAENRVEELNSRLENRRVQLNQERECSIGDVQHMGAAWVLPHPERSSADVGHLVQNLGTEKIAVEAATKYEESRGWRVESVESDNRGFDLISHKPHPEDPDTSIDQRFIEVKGRAETGQVLLSTNEHKTAQRLGKDYWLYVVFNCSSKPELHRIQDPAQLGWEPIVKIEHYHVGANQIVGAAADGD